ncbi:hypothetical protein GN316_15225 [Xylophilus sp. Kf1]|nr:hypothetical protein [Xylophilus sp. Kf1]
MLCHVYRLRHKGTRQGVDEILRVPPKAGWLAYNRPHIWGTPGEHARLLIDSNSEFDLFPQLSFAKVKRIEGGLLLAGMERLPKGRPTQAVQTWAVGMTAEEAAALVRALKRKQDVVAALWAERQG